MKFNKQDLRSFCFIVCGVALFFILSNLVFGTASPLVFLVGIPCPACGMTRAGLFFLSGRFRESFNMHPLFLPTSVFIIWAAALKLFRPCKLNNLKKPGLALFSAAFVLYIYRMVTLFPEHPPMTINRSSVLHNIISIISNGGM